MGAAEPELWAVRWHRDGQVVAQPDRAHAEAVLAMFGDVIEVVPWPGTPAGHAEALAAIARQRAEREARERGYRLDGTRVAANTDHPLRHPWPGDCYVQGGEQGLAFRGGEGYFTAFVEAFPRNPDAFLRGEGETVAEAEDACWARYLVARDCVPGEGEPDGRFGPHGPFDRRGYTNGMGFCVRCGTGYMAFEEIPPAAPAQEPEIGTAGLLRRVFAAQALREGNGEPR